ncbi:RsmB/NOP family class I SAM-dependent RNA methyltransferase [Candidatus Bathyarchaeota archaeon]|nr:MAG: RsmB/NOP family class I SAM-dependent RNA methyltransferase [Candidatus Bathyarchaeota archaeon]
MEPKPEGLIGKKVPRKDARKMRESNLVNKLRLAREALLLVSQGSSERSAVSRIASANPQLRHERSSALTLVIDTVSSLDMLNREVQTAFPGEKFDRKGLALFHLTAHLVLADNTDPKADLVRALRRISSELEGPGLEQLLGYLVAHGPPDASSVMSESERVGLRTHNPPWWVLYCFYHFGRETGLKILSPPPRPRYVRVNPLRNRGRVGLPLELRKYSGQLVETDSGIHILAGSPSTLAKYFETGVFQMQDLASFLAVKAANPAPGEAVLDLCAAPGGKTATLAQFMKNRGRILSVDYSKNRMASWSSETERLGVKIASPLIEDASNLGLKGEFDLVVVDPPCTGTGILDRNPRMKWHLSQKLVHKFSVLQSMMLEESSKYTRPGGRILYCTCSLTIEENELVVSRFLSAHIDFETRPILQDYGSLGLLGQSNCRRFYPHRDRTAGYFIARLERVVDT